MRIVDKNIVEQIAQVVYDEFADNRQSTAMSLVLGIKRNVTYICSKDILNILQIGIALGRLEVLYGKYYRSIGVLRLAFYVWLEPDIWQDTFAKTVKESRNEKIMKILEVS